MLGRDALGRRGLGRRGPSAGSVPQRPRPMGWLLAERSVDELPTKETLTQEPVMHVRIILAIAALFGLGVGSAQAGLYNPAEPEEDAINVHDFARFDQAMENLRMISW